MKTSNLLLSALLITASSQAFATKNIIESVENAIDSPSQSPRQSAQNANQDTQDTFNQAGQSLSNLLNTVATASSNVVGSVNQNVQDVNQLAGKLSNTSIGADTGASGNTSSSNAHTSVQADDNKPAVTPTHNQSTTSSSTPDPQKKSSKSSIGKKEKSNKSSIKNKDKKSDKPKIPRKPSFTDNTTTTSDQSNKSDTTSAPLSGGTVTSVSQPVNADHAPSSSHRTVPTSSVTHPHAGNAASNGSINHPREADQHPVSTTAPGHDVKHESHDKQGYDSQAHGTQPPSKKKNA